LAGALGACATLGACILTDKQLDPSLEVPKTYEHATGSTGAAPPRLEWWRSFHSTELTDLMDQAIPANFDIAAAVAQIVQADAQARIAGAALLPSINGTANATQSQSPALAGGGLGGGGGRVGPLYSTAINASYTLDFWGHYQALLQAAEENAVASRFARDNVTLTALVSVGTAYFEVLEGQDLLALTRKDLKAFEDTLKLIQDRFNQGTAAALDVAQQASLVAIQRAAIPPLVQQIEQNTATLALLLGRAPSGFKVRGGSMYALSIPRVTPGLPSDLLERRPDIRQEEALLAASNANVSAARTAFFPTIQLTGQAGFESIALASLFSPAAAMWSFGGALTQPIFEGGQLMGQLDLQEGIREQQLQTYRKTVISAFTDVERALIAVRQTARQEMLQADAVKESQRAYDLSQDKLRQGTIDLTTLLQIEETLFSQQVTLTNDRFLRLQAVLSLYQALGGGWLKDDLARETPPPQLD
jgi:NodT family efflux transporter outer membrane factor (OMF) lipoprotein